jgi:predicted nucleic acid-binding protein
VIWQAALEHGKTPAGRKTAAQKEAAAAEKAAAARSSGLQRAPALSQDEAVVRNQVLNEVLDAFSRLNGESGMEDILQVIQSLKQPSKPQAVERTMDTSKAIER